MDEDKVKLKQLIDEAFEDDETWSKTPVGYALLGIKDDDGLLSNVDITVIDRQMLDDLMQENFKFENVRDDKIPIISWM